MTLPRCENAGWIDPDDRSIAQRVPRLRKQQRNFAAVRSLHVAVFKCRSRTYRWTPSLVDPLRSEQQSAADSTLESPEQRTTFRAILASSKADSAGRRPGYRLVAVWIQFHLAAEYPIHDGGVSEHKRHPNRRDDQHDAQRLLTAARILDSDRESFIDR